MGHPPIAITVGTGADLKTKSINDQFHYRNEKKVGGSTFAAGYFKMGYRLLYWGQKVISYGRHQNAQLAHLLNRTPTAIVYAVSRIRKIAKDNSNTVE
jgi:hypothetical protein